MSPAADPGTRLALEGLARARGIAISYVDVDGRRRRASDETLVAVLAALGEEIASPSDAPPRLAARRRSVPSTRRARVVVAWDGVVNDPPSGAATLAPLTLHLEGASSPERLPDDARTIGAALAGTILPFGVHELADQHGGRIAWIVSAPRSAPPIRPERGWALFAPTYALHDARERDAGDLTALGVLGALAGRRGAGHLATLPLLAEWSAAEGAPPGQRPYAPLSRMWWNEGYLDLDRLPELAAPEGVALAARARAGGAGGRSRCAVRRAADGRRLADVSGVAATARPALEHAAATLAAGEGPRRAAFEAFLAARPDLETYARFRAAGEVAGPDPARWPPRWRRGDLSPAELPPGPLARHRYAQFAMDAQLGEVAGEMKAEGCGLLLDVPVGCTAGGYDPWANPSAFAAGVSVGAPPDGFFTGGQDWGFPPPHPETDRAEGYPLLRRVLAHHAAHATVLRVDHVLGWARLWWVPAGHSATEGAYVRYPTEELLALACLEAARAGCSVVGEDLGTVPAGLRPALRRHGVDGMRVAVFDIGAAPRRRLRPPAGSVAYLATHDTATFAAFVTGEDLVLQSRLGLGPTGRAAEDAAGERSGAIAGLVQRLSAAGRIEPAGPADPWALLGGVVEELGESPADLVVVAVDDLLGELEPQNIPGTTTEHDNFSRTLAATLESLDDDPRLDGLLARLDRARRRAGPAATVATGVTGVTGVGQG